MAKAAPFDGAVKIGERRYKLEYRRKDYEVVCNEYKSPDGGTFLAIPYYLFQGRKYPAHVYIYAIILYSSDPKMSQRAVAKATREKFGLQKFSHSTLCRTFKALEESIEKAKANPASCGSVPPTLPAGQTGGEQAAIPKTDAKSGNKRAIQSVNNTLERRKAMSAFIKGIAGSCDPALAIEHSRTIIKHWHDTYGRMLI